MPLKSIALLQTVLASAEADRDTAQGQLHQAEQQLLQARQQADSLHQYRSEYDQRWVARFRQSGTPALLQCHRSFGQRLDGAIGMQDNTRQHLEQRLQLARQALLARAQRVAAVRKLIERRQTELRQQTDQREQRNTDEAAQRSHGGVGGFGPLATGLR